MTTEVTRQYNYRHEIPRDHRTSLDTRLRWLWNQRFGTVQTIWKDSPDTLDKTAATTILQAIAGQDLESILLLFRRLEGGPVTDEAVSEQTPLRV